MSGSSIAGRAWGCQWGGLVRRVTEDKGATGRSRRERRRRVGLQGDNGGNGAGGLDDKETTEGTESVKGEWHAAVVLRRISWGTALTRPADGHRLGAALESMAATAASHSPGRALTVVLPTGVLWRCWERRGRGHQRVGCRVPGAVYSMRS